MIGSWVEYPAYESAGQWVWSAAQIVGIGITPRGTWSFMFLRLDGTFKEWLTPTDIRVITDAELAKYRQNYRARARYRAKRAAKRSAISANK